MSDAVKQTLDGLDDLADVWACEVNVTALAQAVAHDAAKVEAMMRESFVEGAYRGATGMSAQEIDWFRAAIDAADATCDHGTYPSSDAIDAAVKAVLPLVLNTMWKHDLSIQAK